MDDRIDNSDFIVNAADRESVIEYEQNRICTDTARKFRECRAAEGITQAELGKLAGVSQPNITRFESGNYNPSLEFLVKIAAAMNRKVSISIDNRNIDSDTVVSIGNQGFDSIRESGYFYIDKTYFIKEWWESGDAVTLITRPRRFGKTLNMSMLECFFSVRYRDRRDLFDNLYISDYAEYMKIQGTYPVIFVSFAAVKQTNCLDAIRQIKVIISDVYSQFPELYTSDKLTDGQRKLLASVSRNMDDVTAQNALNDLSSLLTSHYGKKVIVLLDEYDTPLQEAYINGYWQEMTSFIRSLFNATFKSNRHLERAVMTGITRVSKESIFSDLNNLNVITSMNDRYADCFGFTEKETFAALDSYGLGECKDAVKRWYDGFSFGHVNDIYNPWSITNYIDKRQFRPYWVSTSSNEMISRLLREASVSTKEKMELLIRGYDIVVNFDEQIVFDRLEYDDSAIWSLLLASGYLKIVSVNYSENSFEPVYHLRITNTETLGMFCNTFRLWFNRSDTNYNRFVTALLDDNLEEMNIYMNDVAMATISSFDSGRHPSDKALPEKFFHGFVLGLLVELRDRYVVKSNHESGYGRCDVIIIPKSADDSAIIMEFKVHSTGTENNLQDTVNSALRQIIDKNYDAELYDLGFEKDHIRHYGFAFEGKRVLIGKQKNR